jgi:predicted nucleic acid-binding protein
MILADTSIWIDQQRGSVPHLNELLVRALVVMHPWVVGELACGSLSDRDRFLQKLRRMPQIKTASEDQVLLFMKMHQLFGKGIGYVDMHLLSSTALSGARFWTRDKRVAQAATDLNIAHIPWP